MKTIQVAKMPPLQRFLYWIKERHAIYLRRKAGQPKPWTDDEVLQQYFFTNPYREHDKTTVWFRENVRNPLRNDPKVLMATVIFRWFNYIPTGKLLMMPSRSMQSLLTRWDPKRAVRLLSAVQGKVFTGAYIISGVQGLSKIEGVCQRIGAVYSSRQRLLDVIGVGCTLQEAVNQLSQYQGIGRFMAYEIACDLRYTYLLERASDVNTWCNQGPGARRGLNRVLQRPLTRKVPNALWAQETSKLLNAVRRLDTRPLPEMREVEHSLCEFDKYERARLGQGHMRRKYDGR